MESKYYKEHFWGVSQLQAVYQEREAQIGVDTSNGFFMSEDPALLFEGSRTHEVCFTTGEDVQTLSCIVATRNGEGEGRNVFLYVSNGRIRAFVGGSPVGQGAEVQPNTTYHVVLSVDADNTKADMYVNGVLAASVSSFSDYQDPNVYLVGTLNYLNDSYPFKGVIHYHRLFNYALSAYDAALLWDNGDPTGYMLPSSWKCPAIEFPTSVYTASRNTFSSNSQNVASIMTYDVPAANGFSGLFMRNEAIKNVSMYCNYRIRDGRNDIPIKITMEYRSNCDMHSQQVNGRLLLAANDAEAKAATIIYSYDDGPGYLFAVPISPDSWAEMRILSIESVGCVAEYLPQNLVPAQNSIAKVWINSAQESLRDMTYVEPILDNLDSSNLNVLQSPTILYNEEVWYGIEWHISASDPHCTRIGNLELHKTLPIQNKMRGCILNDTGTVVAYLNPADWTVSSVARDGSVGNVMVEIPSHYRKFETIGDVCRCKISEYPLPGYHHVPTMYISAYEATVQRSTSKLASVVNTTEDYRGGNNNAEWDGTYRSLLGLPATNLSRTQFREYARNINKQDPSWNCLDYNVYKAVFWLYYVEYANRNCQSAFNAEKDANGFAQGGLGNGVTTLDSSKWSTFNSQQPFIPCGYTDALGNGTGEVEYSMPAEYDTSITKVKVPRYRGIENPFGHIWKWTDGINIRYNYVGSVRIVTVWVASDPSKYNDSNEDGYEERGQAANTSGYIETLLFGENGDIIATDIGIHFNKYWLDSYANSRPVTGGTLSGVYVGGEANEDFGAGLACTNSGSAPSVSYSDLGSRLCFIPQNEIIPNT